MLSVASSVTSIENADNEAEYSQSETVIMMLVCDHRSQLSGVPLMFQLLVFILSHDGKFVPE